MIVKGIELNIDLWDIGQMKKYVKANDLVIRETTKKITDVSKAMRYQCDSVYKFVKTLFGKSNADLLISDRNDFKNCVDVFTEITKECVEQINKVKAYNPAIKDVKKQ